MGTSFSRVQVQRALSGLFLSLLALLAGSSGAQTSTWASWLGISPFKVTSYELLSKTPVPGSSTMFDYVYRVQISNSGAAAVDVISQATSNRSSVQVSDANLSFGNIAANGSKVSNDTLVVRAGTFFDRRLDRKVKRLLGWAWEVDGYDPPDLLSGLWTAWLDLSDAFLNDWYRTKLNAVFSWKYQIRGDATAPVITSTLPTTLTGNARPAITAAYSDALAGVDAAQTVLKLDGAAVTATASATGVSYTPAAPLADGLHSVNLTVVDFAANATTVNWTFNVDATAPVISAQSPNNTATASPSANVTAVLADAVAGVDVAQVQLTVDGVDVSANVTRTASSISYRPAAKFTGGQHTVVLKVRDLAGNLASATWSFGVDDSAPAVTDLAPASGAQLAADALPTIRAAIADNGAGIDLAQTKLFLDAMDITAQSTVSASGVTYTPAAALTEGAHTVKLQVADRNGNVAVTSWSFTTSTLPVITSTTPKDTFVNGTTPAQIVAQYQDVGSGIDISKVALKLDNVDVSSAAQITATGLKYAPASLSQGVHQVQLVVYDKAGFSASTSWQFTVDTLVPTVSGQQPANTALNQTRPVVSANVQDSGSGLDATKLKLLVDGVDVTAQAQVTASASGLTVSWQPAQALADGAHTVGLLADDKAGNHVDSVWNFSTDAQGPLIATLVPAQGASLAADAPTVFSASYTDAGTGIDANSLSVQLDGQNITALVTVTATGFTYAPAQLLSEGSHMLSVSLKDKAGNAASQTNTFVTASLPVISAQSPRDVFATSSKPTISASFNDVGAGVDVSKLLLTVDGVDVTSSAQKSATGISYQPTAALAEGTHQVVLTVRDAAGNTSQSSWQFKVDATLPVISSPQPVGTQVNTSRPTISASLLENGSGLDLSKTKLLVNGVDVTAQAQFNTATMPASMNYVPAQPLVGGAQTVKLTVVDLAGNQAESTWTFTLDGEGPVIGIVSPAEASVMPADAKPLLQTQYSDAGTGVNAASLLVELDGVNITAQVAGTAVGFTFTPAQALSEGAHSLRVRVADTAGNVSERSSAFVTRTAPVISEMQPKDVILAGGSQPTITASYSDVGAGVDVSKVKLLLDGVDVTAQSVIDVSGIAYAAPQALGDSDHKVQLTVADRAGNETGMQWRFATAQPPEISSTSPRDVVLPLNSRPTIAASFRDTRVGVDPGQVRLIVNGDDVTALAQISATGVSYTPVSNLPSGPYTVYLEVANLANASVSALWGFEVDVAKTYSVAITTPSGGMTTTSSRLQVEATAFANQSYPTELRVNGVVFTATGMSNDNVATYSGQLNLIEGSNTLTAHATFADGETRSVSTVVTYYGPPKVTITSPVDKSTFGRAVSSSPQDLTGNVERPVKITGTVSKPATSVTVNQQAAVLSDGGRAFTFNNFFLHEGMNVVTVVATDDQGRTGTSAMMLSVDQTAPILSIEHPLPNSVTSASTMDVRGVVNDAVEGFAGAAEPTVTVNGISAQVSDRYYLAQSVPLVLGENALLVVATDSQGNSRTQTLKVSRVAVGSNRLTLLSGNHQQAASNTELAKPLTVVALDDAGQPLVDLPVTFDVLRGTGSISPLQGQASKPNGLDPARSHVVRTDASGRAKVWFTTGRIAGPGANVVRASVDGVSASVTEDVFFSATTSLGNVAKVLADLGVNQFAEAGTQPLELMSVVVRDKYDNHLPGVSVTFTVEEGDAYFPGENGARSSTLTLVTDKNGLTATRPMLGNTAGLVRIVARAADSQDASRKVGNATFVVQVKEAKDGPTVFKGFIYTDKGEPLPGVRLSVSRTSQSSTTDEKGAFVLSDLPPGRIDLFVDGRTTNYQGKTWPSLHFEAYAVRGQENLLSHPVYLPPLSMGQAKTVGGNQDVILTIPGIEGFQMKVKANSVTFPDGSKVGTLVVSPVTADRLPMAPPAGGTQFGVPAWTVQPAGTRFDPPIEVTLPNSRGYPRGETQPVVQWDHDLGQFVPMGRATVNEDGSVLITDAGSGLTKAGWGGLCVYDPDKCGKNSPKCGDCQKSVTLPGQDCPTCDFDPSGGPFPKTSMGIDKTIHAWGPTGALKVLFQDALGISGEFSAKVKGERSTEPACCERTKSKKEKQSTQVAGAVEVSIQGDVGKNTPVGRALALFKTAMFVRFKGGGALQAAWETDYCKEQGQWDSPASLSAQVTGAGEAGLRFGSAEPSPDPVSGVAVEGYGGLEAQGEIVPPARQGFLFDIRSKLSVYFQIDVVAPGGSMTLFKRSYDLPGSASVDVRSLGG